MGEWPKLYHPARYDSVLDAHGSPTYVVDESVTVEGYQLQPDTWDSLAEWCSGTQLLNPRGIALGSLDPDRIARFGDFVMRRDGDYTVERADGFYQRFAPVEP
jgi:hypothetical protein